MKKSVLFVIFIITSFFSQGQVPTFLWAKQMPVNQGANALSMAVDASGNVYTTGFFQATVDFDPGVGTFTLNSGGSNYNAFISKLDASGNFVWAKSLGGFVFEEALSICLDPSGNVLTTGFFNGTADFDPGPSTFTMVSKGSSQDIFVSKLDANGNFLWAKSIGANGTDHGNSIITDASGNIYCTGQFNDTVDFNPGVGVYNLMATGAGGNYEAFILKLDPSGNFVWAKQVNGTANDEPNSIAIDASGNVYTTGYFYGTADFDPGPGVFNLTTAAGSDAFISKLTSSGSFVWAKQVTGNGDEIGYSITIDPFGNVCIGGTFDASADFDPGGAVYNLTPVGSDDGFVIKLDNSGNFIWAKAMGGNSYDVLRNLDTDGSGNVFCEGVFTGTADFDPASTTYTLAANPAYIGAFISKLDASGNFQYAEGLIGPSSNVFGGAFTLDNSGNLYVAGNFNGTADFDPNAGIYNLNSSSFSNADIFVMKLGNFVGIEENNLSGSEFKVFPNPSNGSFYVNLNESTEISISNVLGEEIFSKQLESGLQTINLSEQASGIYFAKISQGTKQEVVKLVKE